MLVNKSTLHNYRLFGYPFYIITPALCFLFAELRNMFVQSKIGTFYIKIFEFIGQRSLEIYLADAFFIAMFFEYIEKLPSLLIILLSLSTGILYFFIYNKLKSIIIILKIK